MDYITPLGQQILTLFKMFNVSLNYFSDESGKDLHLEFIPVGFDANNREQAQLLASICYHIKTGFWKVSVEALKKIIPSTDTDLDADEAIKLYFSGENYNNSIDKIDHFQKQRNPFILEVMANCMLHSIEMTPNYNLSIVAMNRIHLSSKIQGLDAAALACSDINDYFIVIGEAKNRETPSEGTKEAFESFKKHDQGKTWADIRQLMGVIADAAKLNTIDGNDLSEKISKWSLWKEKYIYRLSIEHKVKNPHGGSQFKDFALNTSNVKEAERRQCEAFDTNRLTGFYDIVSAIIVDHLEKKGGKASA